MTKSNKLAEPDQRDVRDNLTFKLARVTTLNDRIGQRVFSTHLGLSLREFRTLSTLSYLGLATMSALARESFLDFAQISRIIGTLIDKGLVERVGSDGRGGVLQLTGAGRQMVDRGLAFAADQNARLTDGMAAADQARLIELIDQLLDLSQQRYRDVNGDIADLVPDFATDKSGGTR